MVTVITVGILALYILLPAALLLLYVLRRDWYYRLDFTEPQRWWLSLLLNLVLVGAYGWAMQTVADGAEEPFTFWTLMTIAVLVPLIVLGGVVPPRPNHRPRTG